MSTPITLQPAVVEPSLAITVKNVEQITVFIDPTIVDRKALALETASGIFSVDSPESQAEAVRALQQIRAVRKVVETSRKACKSELQKPVETLDQAAKAFDQDLANEEARLTNDVNAYQAAERKRAQEAEQARQEAIRKAQAEADRIAREAQEAKRKAEELADSFSPEDEERKAAALAQAKAEELKRQQEAAQKAAQAPLAPTPAKTQGMVVTEKPMFEVLDIHELYKAAPHLVRMEPNTQEINRQLSAGIRTIAGLRIWVETKTTFRS